MSRGVLFATVGALALLLLSLMQAAALLPSCGLQLETSGYLRFNFCPDPGPAGPSPELAATLQRRATLEDRLHDLERRLAGLPACTPVREPPPPPPDPNRLDAERWEGQDIALLEGCWSLASDYSLRNRTTGEVTTVEAWRMCFDAEGRGDQRLARTDGDECTGDVSASFAEDGTLEIRDDANVRCSGGSYIYRREISCTLEPSGEADCETRQPETGRSSNVRIVRREPS